MLDEAIAHRAFGQPLDDFFADRDTFGAGRASRPQLQCRCVGSVWNLGSGARGRNQGGHGAGENELASVEGQLHAPSMP
jgi:hypothetical protein